MAGLKPFPLDKPAARQSLGNATGKNILTILRTFPSWKEYVTLLAAWAVYIDIVNVGPVFLQESGVLLDMRQKIPVFRLQYKSWPWSLQWTSSLITFHTYHNSKVGRCSVFCRLQSWRPVSAFTWRLPISTLAAAESAVYHLPQLVLYMFATTHTHSQSF